MIKLPNVLLIAILLTTSTVNIQAISEEEFLEVNRQYTQAYFNYLQFKQEAPQRAELLKKAIDSGLVTYKEAYSIYLREKKLLLTLENELAGIVNETLETTNNVTEAKKLITNLKDDAVTTGLFESVDVIDDEAIALKVAEREVKVDELNLKISELELKISTIKMTTEWITLVDTYNTLSSALDSSYSKRVFLESDINKYMGLIAETNSELNILQANISDLEIEEVHLDNAFPVARRRVEDARNELSNINTRLSDAELVLSRIDRERSGLNFEQRTREQAVQLSQSSLDEKVIRLRDLERSIGRLPTLRTRLRDLNNNKIPQVNQELQRAQNQVDQVRNSLERSQRDMSVSVSDLESTVAQKDEAIRQISNNDRQVNSIKRKIEDLKKEEANISQYEGQLRSLNQERSELGRKLENATRELRNAKNNVDSVKQRHQRIVVEVREANVILSRIDSEKNQIQRAITQYNDKIKKLEQEIKVLERAGNSTATLEQSLRDSLQVKVGLEQKLQNNTATTQNLKRKVRDLTDRIEVLKDKVTNGNPSREESRELLKEIKLLSAELKKVNDDLSKAEANITRLGNEITREERKISNLRAQISSGGNAARRIQELRAEINNIENDKRQEERKLNSKNREYNEAKASLSALVQNEQTIKTELTNAEALVNRSERAVNSTNSEIRNNENQVRQVTSRLDSAKKASSEIIVLRSEIQRLGTERSDFEVKLNRAERRITELRRDISVIQVAIQRVQQNLENLRKNRNQVRSEVASLTAEASSLSLEINRLASYGSEAERLRNSEIPRLRAELANVVRELESINIRLQIINQEYVRQSVQVEDMTRIKKEAQSLFEVVSTELSLVDERIAWVKGTLKTSRTKVEDGFRLLPEYRKSLIQAEGELSIINPKIGKLEQQIVIAKDAKDYFYVQNLEPLVAEKLTNTDELTLLERNIAQYSDLAKELVWHLANIDQYTDRLSSLAITKVVVEGKVFDHGSVVEASENEYKNKEAAYRVSVNDLEALRSDIVLKREEVRELKDENDRTLSEVR